MKEGRLIIVSNRLPFRIKDKKGVLTFSPSAGGLVSSIKSYIEKTSCGLAINEKKRPVWVGSAGISQKKLQKSFKSDRFIHEDFELAPVFISPPVENNFYNGFCNDTVWPLFHYFPSYAKFKDEYYDDYVKANMVFCEKIMQLYKPNDIIWIHDYHLMLLPEMLRQRLPEAVIGFFLHIPFPSFELFRILPSMWRKDLLKGMLGADLIGFHTNDYVQYFLKSIRQILGYNNVLRTIMTPERTVTVDTFPVSVDYHKFNTASENKEIISERNKIKNGLENKHLIISVDRLDYTKGLINRLEGFELFLTQYPEFKNKVILIMIVVPSRDIIPHYTENKKSIEELVSRINGKFGNLHWTPVVYQYKELEFKKLTALYLAADVALITPLRDGMNLVAKEFVVTRADKRGVLILSETAGAASELGEVMLVNPNDRHELALTIKQALEMLPEEQIRRNEAMQERIREYDVLKWAEDFISQLKLSKTKNDLLRVKEMSISTSEAIVNSFVDSPKRLIFLDYDGTLTPLARLPHLASPSQNILQLLQTLGEDERNSVVLISGRTKEILQQWFGNLPINMVAEHGAYSRRIGNNSWKQLVSANSEWKSSVIPLLKIFSERCPGAFVEEKSLSLAWHYRNSNHDLGFLRSRELINALMELTAHLDFQIIDGSKVVEAKARGIDKGTAASRWIKSDKWDFILAIGDDKTDEDLFSVIPPENFSIRVGLVPSTAKYNFRHQQEVVNFLQKLSNNTISAYKLVP